MDFKHLKEFMDPLAFEPGRSWNYSICYDVLAAFISVVSAQNFGAVEVCHARMTRSSQHNEGVQRKNVGAFLKKTAIV